MTTATNAASAADEGGAREPTSTPDPASAPRDTRLKFVTALTFVLLSALVLVGLGGFGVWDPWELDGAEAAQLWARGEHAMAPGAPLSTWLSSLGFRLFGVREWTGRLPIALSGLVLLGLALALARDLLDRRAGLYAAIVVGTSPVFLLNARQMIGAAPHMAAQALVGWCALRVIDARPTTGRHRPEEGGREDDEATMVDRRQALLVYAPLVVAVAISGFGSGVLLGPLPPLFAAAVVIMAHPSAREDRLGALILSVLAAVLLLGVIGSIRADLPHYTAWLGGGAHGTEPPTFERDITRFFHGFAPWSALFIPALGALLIPTPRDGGAWAAENVEDASRGDLTEAVVAPGRLLLVVWFAASFAATTVYASRYGYATLYAVAPAGVAIALLLRRAEREEASWWGVGLLTALFAVLVLRDFLKYPGSAIQVLPAAGLELPDGATESKTTWAALLVGFAGCALLGFANDARATSPERGWFRRFVRRQLERGRAFYVWFTLLGLLIASLLIFSILVFLDLGPFTTLAMRLAKLIVAAFVAVPLLVMATPKLLEMWGRVSAFRFAPLFALSLIFGGYFAHRYVPMLSQHLSPAMVFDTYNELRGEGDTLGEHQVGGRAAAYYADGEVEALGNRHQVVQYLAPEPSEDTGGARRWAVFPTEELLHIADAYRRRAGRHLYIADARSASLLLATSEPIDGRPNQSVIARSVLEQMPGTPERQLGVRFGPAIELVGYDLELPGEHDGTPTVGAGQDFTVVWYWRARARSPGGYKVFLHVDGHGERIHGDHDPVDGNFPVRLWREGDIIVDRQTLTVPATYASGEYTFWIGMFAGSQRLEMEETPTCSRSQGAPCIDADNRLNAGPLVVR